METTIKRLRKLFKKAAKRADKAIDSYAKFTGKLYMPYGNEIVNVGKICFKHNDHFENATDLSWTFYRRGRGGKFYEKPQSKREGFSERAWDNYRQAYQLVGQDYLDLCKLEYAIDVAIYECESLLGELEKLGVDVYNDADLWQ